MATRRKRAAKSPHPGENQGGAEKAGVAEEQDAKIARSLKETFADNPAPESKRKLKAFDEHLIRERAYAIWVEEGRPDGRDVEHWIKARVEIEREAA